MLNNIEEIMADIWKELDNAQSLHPHWPGHDLVHAAGIVSEESGELIRAALRHEYAEGGTLDDVRTEAVQTATTAIRLLMNLEGQTMNKKVMDDFHVYETLWKAKCDDCQCDDDDERGSILDEAKDVINGERQNHYGDPEDSFALIAEYWSTYMEKNITPQDVAMMMVLFKLARESHQHKRDNLVDAAGYLGILGDMCEGGQD